MNEVADIGISDVEEFEVDITGVHFKAIKTKKGYLAIIAFFFKHNKSLFSIFYNVFHSNPYVANFSKKNLEKFFPINTKLVGVETLNEYTSLLNQRYTFVRANVTVVRKNKFFNLRRVVHE